MIKHSYKYGTVYFPDKIQRDHFFEIEGDVRKNTYQEYVNITAKKYARPNSNILDIGANVGIFTVSLSKIFPNAKIHSFEPVNFTFEHLNKAIKKNNCKNVILHNYGLSDKKSKCVINWSKENIGGASIDQCDKGLNEKNIINIKKLDDLNIKNISFIKVDVQDHELNVILGAKNTLIKNDLVLILEIPTRNENEKRIHTKCREFLKKIGYKYCKRLTKKDFAFRKRSF